MFSDLSLFSHFTAEIFVKSNHLDYLYILIKCPLIMHHIYILISFMPEFHFNRWTLLIVKLLPLVLSIVSLKKKKKHFSALHLLIVAALTKCHKLGSLKQQKLVLSQSGVQKSESKVAVEWPSLWGLRKMHSLPLVALGHCQPSLVFPDFTPISASIFKVYPCHSGTV